MASPLRIGVLGSGKGSNYRAIAEAIDARGLPVDVRIVISDVCDAPILKLARQRGTLAEFVPPGRFKTRLDEEAELRIVRMLRESEVEIVVLAGFMRMIKARMLDAFPRRIINIHPSLLPNFPGLAAWKQALVMSVKETGCTVHYVDAGMDTGEIIKQRVVPVLPDDTSDSLHARIQEAEHLLYPEVLSDLAAGPR